MIEVHSPAARRVRWPLAALLLCAAGAAQELRSEAARPRYTISPDGRVLPEEQAKPAGRRVRSDFDEPARGAGAAPTPAPAPARNAARRKEPDPQPLVEAAMPPLDLGSALLDVFQRVGHPSDLLELATVVCHQRLTVFDAHGGEIGIRDLVHEADLREAARDRLSSQNGLKVYGRDGGSVWVKFHGMDWPALESEARDELDLFGTLMRMPWCFADTRRFVVFPKESLVVEGKRLWKLRIEARAAGDDLVGPRDAKPPVDTYELLCPADSLEPHEVTICRANGTRRTLRLLEWRDVGGVRMPHRRVFLSGTGTRALELVTTRFESAPR